MFSFNISSLKTISNLDDAMQKNLARSWARKCVQGSFNPDVILGDVFVQYSMYDRLITAYEDSRSTKIGKTVVVYGRNVVGKTTSAVGLVALTQENFSDLPFAFITADNDLRKSLCQLLICRETWTNSQIVSILFEALKPYSDAELAAIKATQQHEDFWSRLFSGIPLCGGGDEVVATEKDAVVPPDSRERYDPDGIYPALPVLVIDDMTENIDVSLVRSIYQEASRRRIFVVITTPSEDIANRLCGLNGQERIMPYHLENTQWQISIDGMATIDWTGSDIWTKEEIVSLIRATFPSLRDLPDGDKQLQFLDQAQATVGRKTFDLRMPVSSVAYTQQLLLTAALPDLKKQMPRSIFRVKKRNNPS